AENDTPQTGDFEKSLDENISKILDAASEKIEQTRDEMRQTFLLKLLAKTVLAGLGMLIIAYFLLNGAHMYRQTRRSYRRRKIINYIKQHIDEGEAMDLIKRKLHARGYSMKYIDDAIYRFERRQMEHEVLLSLLEKFIYFSLINHRLRKFETKDQIVTNFMSKGFDSSKVEEAFYLLAQRYELQHARQTKLKSFYPRSYRHMKRILRRRRLFALIEAGLNKKKSHEEIYEILTLMGYKSRHIEDAFFRYDDYKNRDFWLIEFLRSLETEEQKKKRLVHQLIRDGVKDNRPTKAIIDDLVNAGIRADDAMSMLRRYRGH
ncbi:hypothetical protein KY316_01150, partial [Candidatus Woesearchaeota archaeon]|nr:hypothetical protein [Candidatus Woesearchaeota archaeon]